MPWFPDFVSAVELARQQTRAAGQADPVAQYFDALTKGNTHDLETAWPAARVCWRASSTALTKSGNQGM